jgi:hypothetical protein
MSCRAFLPTPVPQQTIRTILDRARRAPSGGNLQPWHLHVLTGRVLAEFRAMVQERMHAHPRGEGSEYDVYPPELKEPYRSRRFKCGEDMYATISVPREDKLGRLLNFARNFEMFGAPAAMFFAPVAISTNSRGSPGAQRFGFRTPCPAAANSRSASRRRPTTTDGRNRQFVNRESGHSPAWPHRSRRPLEACCRFGSPRF